MVQTNFENMVRMSFANLFSENSKELYRADFNSALKEALKTTVQGYIACQEGMRLRKDRFETLKAFDGKKLLIIGAKDPVVNGKDLLSEIKNTTIKSKVFSEGHMSHIENKIECLQEIIHFIE